MRLTLTTSYAENWCYNIMVTLAMLNEAGEQVGYHSAEDSPLPVGADSSEAPEGFVRRREVTIEFERSAKVRFLSTCCQTRCPRILHLRALRPHSRYR